MSGMEEAEEGVSIEEEERREKAHFMQMSAAMLSYPIALNARVDRAAVSFERLQPEHRSLLPGFSAKLDAIRRAGKRHAEFLSSIVHVDPFGALADIISSGGLAAQPPTTGFDMDKVHTTIKQFVRDWSDEGAQEREHSYGRLLAAVERHAKGRAPAEIEVLVPGSGLGRLAWEFAKRGFRSEGNEWSVLMLLASHYVLNARQGVAYDTIHPFVHIFSNNRSVDGQLREVSIPDVDTHDLPVDGGGFSMAAGDFLECYGQEATWDAVVSSFFLDTARNILAYLERIFRILKPGGILVNLGPLLYHFDDNCAAPSIELCLDEIVSAMESIGFVVLEQEDGISSDYIADDRSMMRTAYSCTFFVAQKPVEPAHTPA
jgi:carnosine N-methyltransferase